MRNVIITLLLAGLVGYSFYKVQQAFALLDTRTLMEQRIIEAQKEADLQTKRALEADAKATKEKRQLEEAKLAFEKCQDK